MSTTLIWIIAFSVLGGVLSVLAAASFLLLPAGIRSRLLPGLVSFAIGALLGAAFLGLMPHALGAPAFVNAHDIGGTILIGLLIFFMLEKMVIWRHCHSDHCEAHSLNLEHIQEKAAANMILIGDGIHNLVDGVLIAAAFLTDIHLGIVTSLAIIAHEIPQEVGDFAILLNGGFSRAKALLFNTLASLATLVGALVAYFFLQETIVVVPYVLAIAAASFIYIAVADLIPGLHRRTEVSATVQQFVLIIAGVVVIYFTHATLH
ncbi:MAG: ZIP family metal transporter [Acidiferrobacterales bacterium]